MNTYEKILMDSVTSWSNIREANEKGKGLWYKIKRFFASGDPNDPKMNAAINQYYRELRTCKRLFPHSSFSATIPTGRTKEDGSIENINVDTFKENPKQVKCVLEARYKLMKFLVNYIGPKKPSELCSRHKYPEKCEDYVVQTFHNAKRELAAAKHELDMIKKHGQDEPTTQFDVTIGKLKQLK